MFALYDCNTSSGDIILEAEYVNGAVQISLCTSLPNEDAYIGVCTRSSRRWLFELAAYYKDFLVIFAQIMAIPRQRSGDWLQTVMLCMPCR